MGKGMVVTPDGLKAQETRAAQLRAARSHKAQGANGSGNGNGSKHHASITKLVDELRKVNPGKWNVMPAGDGWNLITFYGQPVVRVNKALQVYTPGGISTNIDLRTQSSSNQIVGRVIQYIPPTAKSAQALISTLNSKFKGNWDIVEKDEKVNIALNGEECFVISGLDILNLERERITQLKENDPDSTHLEHSAEKLIAYLMLLKVAQSLNQIKLSPESIWLIKTDGNERLYIAYKPYYGASSRDVFTLTNDFGISTSQGGNDTGIRLITKGSGGIELADLDILTLQLNDIKQGRR